MSEAAVVAGNGVVATGPPPKSELTALALSQLAGSKYRKQQLSCGLFQEHLSAPTSNFARKQLEKMGWTEGTGLGKKRNGITSHIKVKKRGESVGLGSEKQSAAAVVTMAVGGDEWWKSSLGDTLAKLGGSSSSSSSSSSKKKKKKKKKNKKDSSDSSTKERKRVYTDEELFEATGGARFGMRAGKSRNLAKWKRTESELTETTAAESSTTTSSSGTKQSNTNLNQQGRSRKSRLPQLSSSPSCVEDDTVAPHLTPNEDDGRRKRKHKKEKKRSESDTFRAKKKRKKEKQDSSKKQKKVNNSSVE